MSEQLDSTKTDLSNPPSSSMAWSLIQHTLFLAALALYALKDRFGISFKDWLIPPECIIWSMLIMILMGQQVWWERKLWAGDNHEEDRSSITAGDEKDAGFSEHC